MDWLPNKKHALIVNTWNDFPEQNACDVDAFPAQALQAYYVLKDKGYNDDDICLIVYHANDSFVDFNGDDVNDLTNATIDTEDNLVTKEVLKSAMENLTHNVGQYDEVTVYLAGHGLNISDNLSALSFEKGGYVTQNEFAEWLDKLYCKRILILLDFCYSGTFGSFLEKPGRSIVCAAEDNKIAWNYWDWGETLNETNKAIFGPAGSAFFHPFWKKFGEGATLRESFEHGWMECYRWGLIDPDSKTVTHSQNPQISTIKRDMFENLVFSFPGGSGWFLIALTTVMFAEVVIAAAAAGTLRARDQECLVFLS